MVACRRRYKKADDCWATHLYIEIKLQTTGPRGEEESSTDKVGSCVGWGMEDGREWEYELIRMRNRYHYIQVVVGKERFGM